MSRQGLYSRGTTHYNWKGGQTPNDKGYLRYTAGMYRKKYVHRVVVETMLLSPLCAPYVFPVKGVIPAHMTVEHLDHVKTHNCGANLMLLQKVIHDRLSLATRLYRDAHAGPYTPTPTEDLDEMPEWCY